MVSVTVTIPKELDNISAIGKASAYRGINRALAGIRTDISGIVRQTYNVGKSEVDKRIRVKGPASYDKLEGIVTIAAKDEQRSNLPLIMFGARSMYRRDKVTKAGDAFSSLKKFKSEGKGNSSTAGVSFKVLRSGGKGYRGDVQIIKGGGGSTQVVRFLKGVYGRKRIKEVRVLSIPDMLSSKSGLMEQVKLAAEARLIKNYNDAATYYAANPDKISKRAQADG